MTINYRRTLLPVPDMTYNVFGETLNLTQSSNQSHLAESRVDVRKLRII